MKSFKTSQRTISARGMETLAECITNPSFIESYISNAAKRRGITIPRHPKIDGADILLRLKPPHWRLRNFQENMNCVTSCCLGGIEHEKKGRSWKAYYFEGIFSSAWIKI
jgi:hypothetical protein